MSSATSGVGTTAASGSTYIDPSFFGQHLENFPSWPGIATPPWSVKSIRLWDAGVTWCDLNPAPGQFNWAPLDKWLEYASSTGADLIYTFGNTPGWAVDGGTGGCGASRNQAPEPSAWQSFVTALVQHANGRIRYYELWNEFDYSYFWAQDVAPMVVMARAAAAIIHGANQGLMVVTPSVSTYDSGGALESLLGSIAPSEDVIDIVGIHTYTQSEEGHGLWPEQTLPAWIGKVRRLMQATGYASHPLWSTEGGWGANDWFQGYSDPASQRAFVTRYYLTLLSLGVDRAYWYAYANPSWGTMWSTRDGAESGGLTPAGMAMSELLGTGARPGWLSGARLTAPCSLLQGWKWTCDIVRPGGYVGRILWASSGSTVVSTPPGFQVLRTLAGTTQPAGSQLTISPEPILLES